MSLLGEFGKNASNLIKKSTAGLLMAGSMLAAPFFSNAQQQKRDDKLLTIGIGVFPTSGDSKPNFGAEGRMGLPGFGDFMADHVWVGLSTRMTGEWIGETFQFDGFGQTTTSSWKQRFTTVSLDFTAGQRFKFGATSSVTVGAKATASSFSGAGYDLTRPSHLALGPTARLDLFNRGGFGLSASYTNNMVRKATGNDDFNFFYRNLATQDEINPKHILGLTATLKFDY